MLSSFKIIRNKRVSIDLQIPQSLKIHNVFLFNLLQKAFIDSMFNRVNESLPRIIIKNKEGCEGHDILKRKIH